MRDVEMYIFIFLLGTTVINFAIAWAARLKTKNREFNLLLWYWASLFITYLAIAVLNDNPTEIAFAFFFQFVPSFLKTTILRDSRGIHTNWPMFLVFQLAGMAVSTYLLFSTSAGFTVAMLPVTVTTILPYWKPIWNSLVTERDKSNWIEKTFSFVLILSVLNHFNHAFFRLEPAGPWWGWIITIALYQCVAVLLPLMINRRREEFERMNLELTLTKLSGRSLNRRLEINELYQELATQVTIKEELTKQLQNSNAHLEEEREMNEILIKTVSHDLANPLTVINAYIDMINSGRIPEDDRKMIWDRIKMNTKSALDMIARIRDAIVTRNQASIVAINDVSIDRSIKRLLTQFESRLEEKHIKIRYENNVPTEVLVAAEENTLTEHVFANVLSNALKFSHDGSEIIIKVTEAGPTVRVEFRDFGVGIDQERLEKRLLHTTEGTRGELGSGFGVMVMGYFLRKFGASYLIQSDGLGHGTSIIISLRKAKGPKA